MSAPHSGGLKVRVGGARPRAFLSLADYFVPPDTAREPQELSRARALVALSWFAGGAALVALLVTAWGDGSWPARRNIVFAAVVMVMATPWLMKWTRSVVFSTWVLIWSAVAGLFAGALNNGGTDSFTMPLFPVVPVAAGILLGVRGGSLISVCVGLLCLGLYVGRDALPQPIAPREVHPWLTLIMLEIAVLVGAVCMWLFDSLQRRAVMEAQEANRAKSEFLANVSHELRTPLNGVLGFCDLLLEEPLGEREQNYAASVRGSAEVLARLVDDLLDVGRLERNKLDLQSEDFSVAALVNEIADWNRLEADRRRLDLRVELDERSLGWRRGDADRLRQILVNLVGNSLKFTESGSVVIRARSDGDRVRFEVTDTGIGVPKENQQRIFERFAQGDGSVARRFGGSGLGLAISQLIVEALGGTIGVESSDGEGSTFWFEVPLQMVHKPEMVPQKPILEPPSSLTVLVAEDNSVNRLLVTSLLSRRGHVISEARNGREALALARDRRFDVILMDIQMPDMDGLTAARHLRSDSECPNRDTPIIALTASATELDYTQAVDAGMQFLLPKPLRPAALDEALARVVTNGGVSPKL